MTRFALATLLLAGFACDPDARVGTEDPDAGAGDGGADGGAPDGALTPDAAVDGALCSCGPSSCGTRICGRSDCGYPCGQCAPTDFCFVGNQCQTGVGPGTACIDAFNAKVWEGDRGFRVCPSDPTALQACTCSGGGAQGWISCAAACIHSCAAPPPRAIACGAASCDATSQVCCTNAAMTSSQMCATAPCPGGNYTRACDGPEDCSGGSCCGGDFPWTATCSGGATCAPLNQFCHTGADCPAAQRNCCPLGGTDVRVCSATAAAGCT